MIPASLEACYIDKFSLNTKYRSLFLCSSVICWYFPLLKDGEVFFRVSAVDVEVGEDI